MKTSIKNNKKNIDNRTLNKITNDDLIKEKLRDTNKKNNYSDYLSNSTVQYIIIIVLGLIAYLQTISFGLVNCDDNGIFANFEYYKSISNLWNAFFHGYYNSEYYRPIVTISFIIDALIGGNDYFINHLTNIVLHLLSCFGVLYLFINLKYSRIISFFIASIYTVHPLFINAVAWLNGRNDLLVGLFSIIAFICFIKYLESSSIKYYTIHLISFFFALFSKELGLVFPFICVTYIILFEKKTLIRKENIILYLAWVFIGIIWYLLRSMSTPGNPQEFTGLSYFFINLPTIPEFISKFVIPYKIAGIPAFNTFVTIIGIALILVTTVLIIVKKERRLNYIIFGIIWYLLFIIPGMFKRMNNADEFFDYLDCRSYLPMIGFIIILLEVTTKKIVDYKNKLVLIIHIVIVLCLLSITIIKVQDYKNPIEFWTAAIKNNPDRAINFRQMGMELQAIGNIAEAENMYMQALKLNPKSENEIIYIQLGMIGITKKDLKQAYFWFNKAYEANPAHKLAFTNMINALFDLGLHTQAIPFIQERLMNFPDEIDLYHKLVVAYLRINDENNARKYATILQNKGDNKALLAMLNQLSGNAFRNNNIDKAIKYTNEILSLDPGNSKALNNAAIANIMKGNINLALNYLEESLKIDPENKDTYYNYFRLYFYNLKNYKLAKKYADELIKHGGKLNPQEVNAMNSIQ